MSICVHAAYREKRAEWGQRERPPLCWRISPRKPIDELGLLQIRY